MPLIATSKKSFDPAPKGRWAGVVYAVVDLGTQVGEYKGERQERHQFWISWELPEVTYETEEGEKKPKSISAFLTLTTSEKGNMLPLLEGWKGREMTEEEKERFDVELLLGRSCYVNVIHKKDGQAKIGSLNPPDDNSKSFSLYNDKVFFSFEDGGIIPDTVPEGIKKIIMRSVEYNTDGQDEMPEEPPVHGDEEDIPF